MEIITVLMNVFFVSEQWKFSHSIDEKSTAEKEEMITVNMNVFFVFKHWKLSSSLFKNQQFKYENFITSNHRKLQL